MSLGINEPLAGPKSLGESSSLFRPKPKASVSSAPEVARGDRSDSVSVTSNEKAELHPFTAVFQSLTAKVRFSTSPSGDIVVQIVDSRTQEVVRELPSDIFFKMQTRLDAPRESAQQKGLLVETAV